MALNLLDSLSSTASAPEKNSLSLKNKDAPDGAGADFGQLLGGFMNSAQFKDLVSPEEATEPGSDQDTVIGQKMATKNSDGVNPDGSASMLGMAVPPAPMLTALVLSPNMTAITPHQPTPDAGSLVAFAKSQGLDEEVAAWLLAAGKATNASQTEASGKTEAASEDSDQDAVSLASAAVAISLLASPGQASAKPLVTSATVEGGTPVQLMPMTTPAAWLTPRAAVPAKAQVAPSLPLVSSEKNAAHTSALDLSQIFDPDQNLVKTAPANEASFKPAAWVMAGVAGDPAQASSLLSASPLLKSLSGDTLGKDAPSQVDGLNSLQAERSPGKLSDPLGGTAISSPKTAESGLTTAQRSELQQVQAEKMGQAIGQRMLSEMEKGHWHLKMVLKPANLGNIEVEMRLRNGELDANFTASQATTRDLLQDGLPRLKDTLTQMGMDVASMNIGGGSSQKNGGDSTPQQMPTLTPVAKMEHQEDPTVIQSAQTDPSGQSGLDVLV